MDDRIEPPNPSTPSTRRWLHPAIAVLLVALALATRLPRLNVFITPDESKWVCRSINFYNGLASGAWGETLQTGHPGVITMWLGVPWMPSYNQAEWPDHCTNPSLSDIIEAIPPVETHDMGAALFAARRGVAVFTAFAIGAAYLLLRRLLGWREALLTACLILVDPFYTAHSRFLHLDALTTSLLYLSVLALAIAVRRDHGARRDDHGGRMAATGWMATSGVLAGLAMLNKSPALFMWGFAGLVLLIAWFAEGRPPIGWLVRRALPFYGAAATTFFLAWPSMWVQPLHTLETVFVTAIFYASNPHTNSNYFWGLPRPDPGAAFYPVALAFRLSPWSSLGLLLSMPALMARHAKRSSLWILAGFVVLYGVFMTMGQKKFDRYLLPVFPFVQTLAAWGLIRAADWLAGRSSATARRREAIAVASAGILVLALGAATVVPHAPYYLTYYNPLVGGARTAPHALLVGWGEGLDQAARALNEVAAPGQVAIARALPGFAPFYDNPSYKESRYDPARSDYVVIYVNEVQRQLSPEILDRYYGVREPLHTVRIAGIDYAWVYENVTHEAPLAIISGNARAGDEIVVSDPSILAREYDGDLPLLALDPTWDAGRTQNEIARVSERAGRVWYVRYDHDDPSPRLDRVEHLWRSHAFLVEEHALLDVHLTLWDTSASVPFGQESAMALDPAPRFGDELALTGWTLTTPTAQWGRGLGVDLDWRALRQGDRYLAVYAHLLDEQGVRWGQGDRWIMDQDLIETVGWPEGHATRDHLAIDLHAGIPPGTYRLAIGVYDRLSKDRLAVSAPDGSPSDEPFVLGEVTVAPSPRRPDPEADLDVPNRGSQTLSPELELLGWQASTLAPAFGETMRVSLYWRAASAPTMRYLAALRLLAPDGAVLAETVAPPASEAFPTDAWRPGEVIWRYHDLALGEDVAATTARLELALVDEAGVPPDSSAALVLTEVAVEGHHYDPPTIAHPQGARLGESIAFLGYDLSATEARAGDVLEVTLYWRAAQPVAPSLKAFVHLLGPGGAVRGQRDSVPLGGRYPTDRWRTDETIVDRYTIEIAADAPAGDHLIEIGMYDPANSAQRVPLTNENGERQQDDRLLLDTPVRITP